ncbi:MAG TPA: alpha/beta hydrolase [Kribbellaceae bacterium]|nr:alpha/beta hydrolase [Kribbellaceae bacterium]
MYSVITSDGRTLAVEQWGSPEGTPILYLHGTPMSRLARYPDDRLFTDLGVRLLTYDRPGYGHSTAQPGRRVAAAAADVVAIADEFGLDNLPLIGVSGGGPHALAAAALYPDRISRVGVLASPAPRDADGLDWAEGMMAANVVEAEAAVRGADAVVELLRDSSPAELPELPANEQAILDRPEVKRMLTVAYAEAVRPGLAGAADDTVALFALPWGFDPAAITVPVRIWHGEQDSVTPAGHARWLAAHIPTAELTIQPDIGHVGHFDAQPAMLSWLASRPATSPFAPSAGG